MVEKMFKRLFNLKNVEKIEKIKKKEYSLKRNF
jgi:hypothetical protein